MDNRHGIYKITNILNNKIYVGSAINLRERKNGHFHGLRKNKHHSQHLQRSFNKYGKENFKFEVLEYVENKENLIEREQFYIDTLIPYYNICKVAGSNLGRLNSDEVKRKMSLNNHMRGKTHSIETKEKMSKIKIGKKRSLEVCQNISKGRIGIIFTEEHKANISKGSIGKVGTMLGKKHSDEIRLKISKMVRSVENIKCLYCDVVARPPTIGLWHNDHCLNKPGIDVEKELESRKRSPELREKQRITIKATRLRPEIIEKFRLVIENRPIIKCPHCGYESKNKGNMVQCHFDKCKQNPDFDYEAEATRKAEISIKLKIAAKNKKLEKCPHCNYESRNKGNLTQNHFDNCKNKSL